MANKEKGKDYSVVLYTDGSAQPNPGYCGYGIHGYTYRSDSPIKMGASQKKNIVTNYGYLSKKEIDTFDNVSCYRKIDTISCYGTASTSAVGNNNQMELMAIDRALELINKQGYREAYILSDSQSSIGAMTHFYDRWEKNGWMTSAGTPVKMKTEIQEAHRKLKTLGDNYKISFNYVKGHSGNLGNDHADKLAKKGAVAHRAGKIIHVEEIGVPSNKQPVKVNDFFTKNRWYFMGGKSHADAKPYMIGDYYYYFTGALGDKKKDDSFGMHSPDGFASIIMTQTEEPLLARIQDVYRKNCRHDYDFVVVGNLDTALTPECHAELMSGNDDIILSDEKNTVLSLPSGKVVCMEYNPAHLSFLQMDRYSRLFDIAKADATDTLADNMVKTDITDYLVDVESTDKKGNKKYALNKVAKTKNYVKVPVGYSDEDELKTIDVILTMKVDLPEKIHLGKLIKLHGDNINISVITYKLSDSSFVYCTSIVVPGVGRGYWTNFDSSLVIIP